MKSKHYTLEDIH